MAIMDFTILEDTEDVLVLVLDAFADITDVHSQGGGASEFIV